MNQNDTIEVAEKLYYEANPHTKMDVPSAAYEMVEKWRKEWLESGSDYTLYTWIHKNKNRE